MLIWPKIILKHFNKNVSIPKLNQSTYKDCSLNFNKDMIRIVKQKESWILKNFYKDI